MFILVGSTVFSLTFWGIEGQRWVEHLFDHLRGGATGFLVFVTALVFFLGSFLDFFEIAFILLPLLAPIAQKLQIDLIWFGVLVGINLQTSFMTPPFGFALFYLRGVAPTADSVDPATGRTLPRVRTGDIYLGSLPFVLVQLVVMGLVIAFPSLALGDAAPGAKPDETVIDQQLQQMPRRLKAPDEQDPMQLLLESMKRHPGS